MTGTSDGTGTGVVVGDVADDGCPMPLADDFDRPARRGTAIGRATRSGHRRGGVDIEGVVASDDGGARLGPLARPGWGAPGSPTARGRPAPGSPSPSTWSTGTTRRRTIRPAAGHGWWPVG